MISDAQLHHEQLNPFAFHPQFNHMIIDLIQSQLIQPHLNENNFKRNNSNTNNQHDNDIPSLAVVSYSLPIIHNSQF